MSLDVLGQRSPIRSPIPGSISRWGEVVPQSSVRTLVYKPPLGKFLQDNGVDPLQYEEFLWFNGVSPFDLELGRLVKIPNLS